MGAAGAHLAVLVPSAVIGYWAAFSVFFPNDDTGYHEWSLRLFASGSALYNDVFSYYGPFHYELWGGLSALTGIDVTTNTGALVALASWLATSLALGLLTRRLTGRLTLAVIVQVLSFAILSSFRNEPMYAGSTALLLATGMLSAAVFLLPSRRRLALTAIGALTGAMLMTKINAGAFAAIAVGYALVVSVPVPRAKLLRPIAIAALIFVGPAVMTQTLDTAWTRRYALLVIASTLAVVGASVDRDRNVAGIRESEARMWIVWLLSGMLAAVGAILGLLFALGTTPHAAFEALVVTASSQASVFSLPISLPTNAFYWIAVAGLAAAPWLQRLGWLDITRRFGIAAVLRLLVGLTMLTSITAFGPLTRGALAAPMEWALPLAWVSAVPPSVTETTPVARFLRTFVPVFAITQSLIAYPVAGTQVNFASAPLLVCGAVCVADGWTELRATSAIYSVSRGRVTSAMLTLSFAALALTFANQYVIRDGRRYRAAYDAGTALPFPGAGRLHLPPAQAITFESIVATLRSRCSGVITMPGMLSFNLWSGLPAPSGMTEQPWWAVLSPAQQQVALTRARAVGRLCLVRNNLLIAFGWQTHRLPDTPLVRFLERDFSPIAQVGAYAISIRTRERP